MHTSAVTCIAAGAAALIWAFPANADSSHAGCHAYGAFVAQALQANVPGGAIVSDIATSGPGVEAALALGLKQAACGP
jgi:hypothetical protein